jgi:hypothetical protein
VLAATGKKKEKMQRKCQAQEMSKSVAQDDAIEIL